MHPLAPGGIDIHPNDPGLREELAEFLLDLLCPGPVIADMPTMTVRANLGDGLLMPTVMTLHRPRIQVEGQGNVTVRTLQHLPAIPTHHKRRKAPPIQHQDALLVTLETKVQFPQELS